MKKTFLIIAAILVLALSACNNNKSNKEQVNNEETETSDVAQNEVEDEDTVIETEEEIDVSNIKVRALDTCYIAGNTAYEYYGFNTGFATAYAENVKAAAKIAGDDTQIYTVLIPTPMDVTLPAALRETITNTSDQAEAIKFMYDSIGDCANNVWILDNLRKHKSEYLYFRTDHHWTALGAYYAYQELAKAMWITPNKLSDYEKVEFDGFLGSFYQHTEAPELKEKPDTVVAYVPMSTNKMSFTDKDGNVVGWSIIKDVSDWNAGSKYNTFIGGDNPYSVIENPDLNDGSSCLVLKESLGNALVPFLVDHYQTVHVIDYRHYKGSLSSFLEENQVDDIIFLNYLSAAVSSTNTEKMANFVK